jgi:hypothetical protein
MNGINSIVGRSVVLDSNGCEETETEVIPIAQCVITKFNESDGLNYFGVDDPINQQVPDAICINSTLNISITFHQDLVF